MNSEKSFVKWIISGIMLLTLACNAVSGSLPQPGGEEPAGEPEEVVPQVTRAVTGSSPETPTGLPQPEDYPRFSAGDVYLASFADYPAESVQVPQKFSGDYSLPLDLAQVKKPAELTLSAAQEELLAKNGFVVAPPKPGEYREFYQIYESLRYDEEPVFVTTDAVYHVYHLLFDKMLRDLERAYFIPYLSRLTESMITASKEQYETLKSSALSCNSLNCDMLAEAARRNYAFFSVAGQLLALPGQIPAEVADLVQPELDAIEAHQGPSVSQIWNIPGQAGDMSLIEDYSQYVPRGHYTREEALGRYFKAMMWYGRLTFRLKDPFETRRALLLVQALRNAPPSEGISAQQLWDNIYSPTTFIVGKADDLSAHEYGVISDAVYGVKPELMSFVDDALLAKFTQAAKNLPPPQINSMWVWIWQDQQEVTPGLRFMGQRFTLDAYVFGQLMYRKVGTQDDPRDLPKGLDVFAALGSDPALDILKEMKEDHYDNYLTQMEKVRKEVAGLEDDSWTQSLYWAWLYALQPLIAQKGEAYPAFMRTAAWQRKEIQTALVSWTELKHDTVLYAKQVMAEMGGGPGEEKPPHGFVEPNPEAYARLLSLARMTQNGLQGRGLLDDVTGGNLENLIDLLGFLKSSAERQLAGEALTDEEYWRLVYFGGELEALTLAAADKNDAGDRNLEDQKAALVTDVATGMDRILLEGVGQPTKIYVVLPGEPLRIGTGAVFTYYEFVAPLSERMTDETWQGKVETGDIPAQPEWTNTFVQP